MSSSLERRSLFRTVFEYGFCPLVVFGSLVVTWLARRHGVGWVQTLFFSSAAPILIVTAAEWMVPYRRDWNYTFREDWKAASRELGKDLLYTVIITRIHSWSLPYFLPRLVPWAKLLGKKLGIYGAISPLPMAARIALLLLIGELFWYWGHRLQHKSGLFWRFHSTHHVPTKLNALKASRNHPVDMLFLTIIGYLPLVLLGAKSKDLMWAALIQSIVNVASHANVPVRGGVFGWFFATPDYHRIHHSSIIEESKTNYGCRLLVWDRLFGTLRAATGRSEAELVVGVAPVGPRSLKQELIAPFYRPVSGV